MSHALDALVARRRAALSNLEIPTTVDGWQVDNEPTECERKRGRPPKGKIPMTQAQRDTKRTRAIEAKQRKNNICIIDMETDPFDNVRQELIKPFLAVIYSPRFDELGVPTDPDHPGCHIIWEEDDDRLVCALSEFLETLPEAFTCYGHNAGKFDYMFLISRLIRGEVGFKGRGIMSCRLGRHALRDSLHLIPEALANIQKDAFDYRNMSRGKRLEHKREIIRYCVSDCAYLYPIVVEFIQRFGYKLTVGQAALCELRSHYPIKKLREGWDGFLRNFYAGGRVECIEGLIDVKGDFKVYDINSSYPNVMAKFKHPIGDMFDYTVRGGQPSENTCFIDLRCDNHGAFWSRIDGMTTFDVPRGRFYTTIHEYNIALKYGLISNVRINYCVDCSERTDFSNFILPLYEERQKVKASLAALKAAGLEGTQAWADLKRDDIFLKIIMNASYGKTGQNPRKFMDYYITDPNQSPPPEWFESVKHIENEDMRIESEGAYFQSPRYWIWKKPAPLTRHTYNNVGVAASVTGAARAVLLEALQHAVRPVYCDTDSIICEALTEVDIHPTRLGAWDIEERATRVIVAGKKLYGLWHVKPKVRSLRQLEAGMVPENTIKNKGVSSGSLAWRDLESVVNGGTTHTTNRAPTFDRYGGQRYIEREIRATVAARTSAPASAGPEVCGVPIISRHSACTTPN